MSCQGEDADPSDCGGQAGQCPIQNWCVCQWAFAAYLERAGGCDKVDTVVCAATNKVAVEAYSRSTRPADQAALACIRKKCPQVQDL